MNEQFSFDVFLSHSSRDKPVVRDVAERLKADGLRVWLDEWEIKPGDSIPAKIEEGLERSRVLVLCMSAHAFGSDWAQLESQTFRFRDPLNRARRFIPLRLDDAPIKGSLAQFLYLDWRLADREQEYAKLLEACRPEGQWPAGELKNSSRHHAKKVRRPARRQGRTASALDRLHTDGLDREQVLQAIRTFHRAMWDYKDSHEWIQRLSGEDRSMASDEAQRSRDATRNYCSSRNDDAWRHAAETLPIILRAGEHLGIPGNDLKHLIANTPHTPEGVRVVEDFVQAVETQLSRRAE